MTEKTFKDCPEESKSGPLLGTAEYISPEMINENKCSYEGDLWALGKIINY